MTDQEHIEQLRAALAPKKHPPPTPQAKAAAAVAIERRCEEFEAELERRHAETQGRIRRIREAKLKLGRNLEPAELDELLPQVECRRTRQRLGAKS
jgi:hypothetical protein